MKKLYSIAVLAIVASAFFRCSDFMEFPPAATFNIDSVFASYTNVQKLVYNMYADAVPLNFDTRGYGAYSGRRLGGGTFASALTDEGQSFHVQQSYQVQQYYVGNVDASFSASWSSAYCGEDDYLAKWKTIRKAYILLENVDRCPDAPAGETERIKGECKLMIATVYFEMFKRYGGVPIVRKAFVGSESKEEIELPRATLQETYDFILSLLNDVIDNYEGSLPANFTDREDEFGRMPMALAYAIKARLILYAASPLYNTATPYSDQLGENSNLICLMKYDKELWKQAADAATEAINYCNANGYRLVDEPEQREDATNYSIANINYPAKGNTEVIWGIAESYGNWGYYNAVRYFSGATYGYACNMVPVNQVERYEIDDDTTPGQYKDWNQMQSYPTGIADNESNADAARLALARAARKAYEEPKLDPRFYASVVYNGDPKYGKYGPTGDVDMADGVDDNGNLLASSFQGQLASSTKNTTILHYLRKFHRGYEGNESAQRFPLNIYFRMAELYLIRAEALNEYNSSPATQVYDDLNKIRTRSGMCNVAGNQTQTQMRETIAHERNIEMFYEDQRWFDLRRTLKSAEKIPVMIYKIQIRKWFHTGAKQPYRITYEKVPYQERWWDDKLYMNPFPKSEINKFYGLIQNPGW